MLLRFNLPCLGEFPPSPVSKSYENGMMVDGFRVIRGVLDWILTQHPFVSRRMKVFLDTRDVPIV